MPPEEPGLIACVDPEVGQVAKEPKHGGPRPGAGRPKSHSDNVAVKMDRQVIHDAKIVAAHKAISLAEYLSEMCRPIVGRDLKEYSRLALGSEEKVRKPPKSKGEPKL
jgi:hypothetical protein